MEEWAALLKEKERGDLGPYPLQNCTSDCLKTSLLARSPKVPPLPSCTTLSAPPSTSGHIDNALARREDTLLFTWEA